MKSLVSVLGAFVLGATASAQSFTFDLNGMQEVPPVPTSGTGTATVKVDVTTGAVTVTGTYQGLTSTATAAHIHGPALVGTSGPIIVTLAVSGGTSGTISGGGTLLPTQVTDLLNGLQYVNVHTGLFTAGEIRGQIIAVGSATAYGGNPPGSLALTAGTPKINTTITMGIDNPLGTQSPGSIPFLGISLGPDPGFEVTGTGTLVPGWGMSGPSGELLISVASPNPIIVFQGPAWSSAGNPALITFPIPDQIVIVGLKVYCQGVMIDPFASPHFGLTNGLLVDIGL